MCIRDRCVCVCVWALVLTSMYAYSFLLISTNRESHVLFAYVRSENIFVSDDGDQRSADIVLKGTGQLIYIIFRTTGRKVFSFMTVYTEVIL